MEYTEKWPGATSNRFPSNRKPIQFPSEFLTPPNGLLTMASPAAEKANERRHFEEKYGVAAAERKLCFRKVAKSVTMEKNRGLRHVDPSFTHRKPRPERMHVTQDFPPSTKPEMPAHMHMVRNDSGLRPQDLPSLDFDFHITQMGRKAHVYDSRNGIPMAYGGDKAYGAVDYLPDYFKQEGLYPTIAYRVRPPRIDKSASGVFKTVRSYEGTSPHRLKWSDRLKRVASQEMTSDVKSLLEWERTVLKETYPNLPDPEETDEERPT